MPLQLCGAEAETLPGDDALIMIIPEFSTTAVSKIKACGKFTAKMFLNSWQALWQKRFFNTEMQSLRKQLLSLKIGADKWIGETQS